MTALVEAPSRCCVVCGTDISDRYANSKTCGDRCRTAKRRRGCTGTSRKVIQTAPKVVPARPPAPSPAAARRELWSAHDDLRRLYATRGFWLEESRLPRLSDDRREKLEAEIVAASVRAQNAKACVRELEVVE